MLLFLGFVFCFFLSGFSFTDTDNSQDRREGAFFITDYLSPLPRTHKHSDIYLQLWMWDDYHIFLIAPLVFTTILSSYHLIYDAKLVFICVLDDLRYYDTRFLLQQSWYGKPVDSNSHRLLHLYCKRTD